MRKSEPGHWLRIGVNGAALLGLVAIWLVACAQDPKEALAQHLRALTDILNANMDDPDTAVSELRKYLDENRTEIQKLKKKAVKLENNMSDRERENYNKAIEEKFGSVYEDFVEAQTKFQEKYPERERETHQLLKDVW